MKILTLDFETRDPYLGNDIALASGWVYYLHHKEKSLFRPLGMAYRTHTGAKGYTTDWAYVQKLVQDHDTLLAHNSQYDFGILGALGISIKDKILLDTKIMAFLYNNIEKTYLDLLGRKYCKIIKATDTLGNAVWDYDLWPMTKTDQAKTERMAKKGEIYLRQRPLQDKLNKYAYSIMDKLQEKCYDIVADYAIIDIDITWALYEFYTNKGVKSEYYSDVLKSLLQSRARGICVDLKACREAHLLLAPLIAKALNTIYEIAGFELNMRSHPQMLKLMNQLKVKVPADEEGKQSVSDKFLRSIKHPIGKAIRDARKLTKLDHDFLQKMVEIQQYTLALSEQEVDKLDYGVIYPHMQLFGAVTGRFSCQGPNIQQIPARGDKELSEFVAVCRKIFVPHPGFKWSCHDFSAQEIRLQLHVATELGIRSADELVAGYIKNPKFDLHQTVADLAHITRPEAKVINLGLTYGMGTAALAENLKVSGDEAKALVKKYTKTVPYLKETNELLINKMIDIRYVRTINNKRLLRGERGWEFRTFNHVIQGSAADQIIEVLRQCYKKGIRVLFAVHDEINAEVKTHAESEQLNNLMENSVKLVVPVVAESGIGENWYLSKPK